jgi:MATE family multidrug resistance protein
MTATAVPAQPRSFVAPVLRLAWPVAINRLGIMGMSITDVVIVGQLAPDELADQALGWAPTGVALVAGIGLLTGVQVLAARAVGEARHENAGGAWRRGAIMALVAGTLIGLLLAVTAHPLLLAFGIEPRLAAGAASVTTVLALSIPFQLLFNANTSFLEALQRPGAAAVAMWIANGVNLALNLVLVPGYGAEGSAMATVASRLLLAAGLVLWIWHLRDAHALGVRTRAVSPRYRELMRIGAAAMVSQVAEAGAFSAMTVIAGRIGESAVASYQILLQILALVFMLALGLSTATAVLVSEAIGRGAPREAARAGWTGLALNTIGMVVAAGLVLLFGNQIGRAFTADVGIALLVGSLAPLAALTLAPDGGQVVTAQALRARGDNWFPTASHVLAYVFVMPPLALYLAEGRGLGVAGLMWAIAIASFLSVGVLMSRFWWLGRRA